MIPSAAAPADADAPSTVAHASRGRLWARVVLAGPLVFVAAIAVMAGGALWLPQGEAGIDHLVVPVLLFPGIWAALFFYACLDRRLLRAFAVIVGLLIVNAVPVALQFT